MIYRHIPRANVDISALGFGTMRFPMIGEGETAKVDDDKTYELVSRAYEKGVNYYDAAWGYCNFDGQRALGKALNSLGIRDKVYVSTKLPMWDIDSPDSFWWHLEEQLKRLDTDYIDFYHFHAMNRTYWEEKVLPYKLIDLAEKAKSQGLIKNLSFSFHDKRDLMDELINTDAFASMLVQYNLIDRSNEDGMAYAASRGMGVFVMGPVGGGNIAAAGQKFLDKFDTDAKNPVELAFRFVLGNPNVTCALSGMTNVSEIDENVNYAVSGTKVGKDEWAKLHITTDELTALSNRYCSGCNYCDVCPKGIKPSTVFKMYNNWKVWGLDAMAKKMYAQLGTTEEGPKHPKDCVGCGACAKKCPQNLDIPKEIAKMNEELETL